MTVPPGCGLAFPHSSKAERRASLRRSLTFIPRPKRHTTDRPLTNALTGPDFSASLQSQHRHNRSLSDKMREAQLRKEREYELLGMSRRSPAPSAQSERAARHKDSLEAVSERSISDDKSTSLEKALPEIHEDEDEENRPPKQQRKPFEGESYRQVAYNQYLSQAFGLPPLNAAQQMKRPDLGVQRTDSDASAMTMDSMEVNFHMPPNEHPATRIVAAAAARNRRPKIQVQIPGTTVVVKRPTSTAHMATQISRTKSRNRQVKQGSTEVSPPSASVHQEVPARLSIVSPLSSVEMPKPRRPFSAFSLEEMTNGDNNMIEAVKVHISDSSDSNEGRDSRSSTYSRSSSASSFSTTTTCTRPKLQTRRHSIAFSIVDPTAAGVFDSAPPPMPCRPLHLKGVKSASHIMPDTNKPLPPEPRLEEIAPLRLPGRSYSRDSTHPKCGAPSPLNIPRSATTNATPSRASTLRSKYTPADLDALDAAFVRSSPRAPILTHSQQPSWEAAQNDLELHLGTINEDDSASIMLAVHTGTNDDPLQISRGPNAMIPSRQAPRPPSASMNIKLSDGSTGSRTRMHRNVSKHLVSLVKGDDHQITKEHRNRISAPINGSLIKASRVLGNTDCGQDSIGPSYSMTNPIFSRATSATTSTTLAAVRMERKVSNESNWSSSGSPETSYLGDFSSSPNASNRGDTTTPETDVSSIHDPTYEEVRARLDLLSPKHDLAYSPPSTAWEHIHDISPSPSPNFSQKPFAKIEELAIERAQEGPIENHNDFAITKSTVIEDALDRGIKEMTYFGRSATRPMGGLEQYPRQSVQSIAISEIHNMYAELPTPQSGPDMEEEERMISADAAEKVLLRILQNLDNLQDLFSTATVSRGFYRTFKRHELPLMKNALYGMSPAAWELRETSPPYPGLEGDGTSPRLDYTPSLYLQHYMRDMYTMIALKSMILIHCESFLRADTITALAGGETERASLIDDAFWRVWTFCQLFGHGTKREDDIVGQMDWLRGGPVSRKNTSVEVTQNKPSGLESVFTFGHGNAGGLSADALFDMTEIWTCLGVLVRGFHGKRKEARGVGIFDHVPDLTAGSVEGEDAALEEWTNHLLTMGPPTVLDVTSPTSPNAATFAHARKRGYTAWKPAPTSRATFLKEAVSRVYQERVNPPRLTSEVNSPCRIPTAVLSQQNALRSQNGPDEDAIAARWRCARHAAEIRAMRNQAGFSKVPLSEDRPMSNYPDVLEHLDVSAKAPPVPALPRTAYSSHKKTASEQDTEKHMVSALVLPRGPQVRDPVDVAVEKLVAMGFDSRKAKRALAESDTGNSVDYDGALAKLVHERKRDVDGMMHYGYRGRKDEGYSGGSGTMPTPLTAISPTNTYTDGGTMGGYVSPVTNEKNHGLGLGL